MTRGRGPLLFGIPGVGFLMGEKAAAYIPIYRYIYPRAFLEEVQIRSDGVLRGEILAEKDTT